ncbi:MAG: nicotinate (nicotinamide) nucleotide adenylyltransferase [Sphaerochaetaceae bacterium]|nr:nicotinate (nicotinamide) nucleotide adenylyltransferase [Sphaerochaetaceae bacterium]
MSLAILGGSFDPVHIGHLSLLNVAVTNSDYNNFLVIPAKVSNFKQDSKPRATDRQRLEMLNLALLDYKTMFSHSRDISIEVCTMELERGGVSYTYDTVMELKRKYSIKERIGLIIGDDHLEGLSHWYEFEKLSKEVEFLICSRFKTEESLESLSKNICYRRLENNVLFPQSSTAIRDNIEKFSNYLSPKVLDYVREKNLYH